MDVQGSRERKESEHDTGKYNGMFLSSAIDCALSFLQKTQAA